MAGVRRRLFTLAGRLRRHASGKGAQDDASESESNEIELRWLL
jgi:hypothetical protein